MSVPYAEGVKHHLIVGDLSDKVSMVVHSLQNVVWDLLSVSILGAPILGFSRCCYYYYYYCDTSPAL